MAKQERLPFDVSGNQTGFKNSLIVAINDLYFDF